MVKVGLVGYGFMGQMHAQCHQATGEAQIVAIVDVEADKREAAEEKYGCETYAGIEDMLASVDIDLVDICTPTYLHEQHVITAAQAGKNILCEKPMSLSVASCDRMIEAVDKAGVNFMVAQVIRFWPEYMVIKKLVDSGQYGRVQWVSARRLAAFPSEAWQNWFADPEKSGGGILDLHIHDQDYIAYLIGAPGRIDARGTVGTGGGLNSAQALGWGHKSGAKSYAEASFNLAPGFPFNMAMLVACERASIKFDMASDPSLMVYPTDGEPFAPELPDPGVGESAETSGNLSALGGYYNEIKYFLDCLNAGKKPEVVTPHDAREAVRICLAAKESVETGRVVEI